MMYPLVLDLADDGIPVTVTCRVLGFSTQAFYKWRKAPVSQRDWDDAHLINAARDIHADDPAFVAMSPRCKLAIVMGQSAPGGAAHRQNSMVVVPLDTPGVEILRSTSVFGYDDSGHGGHAEIVFDEAWVPRSHLLGELHGGFAIAQARLGPGRIRHAMRLIGMAERAFELMCHRSLQRLAFGKRIADQGVFQDWIAEARIRIEQVRLLVLKTAWLMDTVGNKGAAVEISAIKVAAPRMATWVIDHAIQTFGGAGVSQDTPLAEMYEQARMLRIADGPDAVHKMALARRELRRFHAEVAR